VAKPLEVLLVAFLKCDQIGGLGKFQFKEAVEYQEGPPGRSQPFQICLCGGVERLSRRKSFN
jgi:hypothetical protein